ncbi:MAG: hypothetical protein ACYTDT_00720 [Planctomycetota bacterium]
MKFQHIMSGLLLMTALMLVACGGTNNSKPAPANKGSVKAPVNSGDSGKEEPAVVYDYVVGIEGMG